MGEVGWNSPLQRKRDVEKTAAPARFPQASRRLALTGSLQPPCNQCSVKAMQTTSNDETPRLLHRNISATKKFVINSS